jgi:acetyl esterase/lipase
LANIRYADEGRRNLLDLYRHRSRPPDAPVLIHLHGGAFRSGRKNRQALALIYRLASQGWVCISANYRLLPRATFPDQLVDLKRVLAWVREYGVEYGADPRAIFVSGSSAGAHLAALAALTPNDPAFQPGFADVDTSVSAAICLGGYYGSITAANAMSSPLAYLDSDAPPFFVAHGDLDTMVVVTDARGFVDRLRSTSRSPVVYAELPGGHHAFDRFHSIRFEAVVDAIEGFAAWVMSSAHSPVVPQALPGGLPASSR